MNVTLEKLQKLLNSPQPPEPQVFTIDSLHVRQMTVVEAGSPAQMKRCLLNLPSLMIPLMGTYVTSGWERSFNTAMTADLVVPLMGTVSNGVVYLDTEMTVRGRTEHVVMLDDANFRLEP